MDWGAPGVARSGGWAAEDSARCAAAGVPADVGFATKPALATTMITRTVAAGSPARVAGSR